VRLEVRLRVDAQHEIDDIRERYVAHGDTTRAVAEGLAGIARIITSAALILPTVFASLAASIRHGKKLDRAIAPVVAQVIKEWAISRGVTHFTHWFQPQTGLTAEKHASFFASDDDRQPMESFTGAQLIEREPAASSFPSGGLRALWEARGYTVWHPSGPGFIVG